MPSEANPLPDLSPQDKLMQRRWRNVELNNILNKKGMLLSEMRMWQKDENGKWVIREVDFDFAQMM